MPIIGGRQVSVRGLGFQGAGKPSAPTINSVTVSSTTSVTIAYTLGSSNGAPITTIGITSSPSLSLTFTNTDLDGSVLVTGSFASNQTYTFTMTATNAVGTSNASSPSSSVNPNPFTSFISFLYTGDEDQGYSTQFDSSGNLYLAGARNPNNSGTYNAVVAKYDKNGSIQWQRRPNIGFTSPNPGKVGVDGSGNVYYAYNIYLVKYNSSGTAQWFRNVPFTINDLDIDSSGNVYIVGGGVSGFGIVVMKLDGSANITWQRSIGNTNETGGGVAVDSSGNVYVVGTAFSANDLVIAKWNSSGTFQWQRGLGDATFGIAYRDIAVDSSGNPIVLARSGQSPTNFPNVAKYDGSGTLQWQTRLNYGSSGSSQPRRLATDSSGNIIVVGSSFDGSKTDPNIIKLNSSGSIVWENRFTANTFAQGYDVDTDSSGNITVAMTIPIGGGGSDVHMTMAVVPGDGSKTGASVSIPNGSASLSYVSGGYGGGSSIFTTQSMSLTAATPTLSLSTNSSNDLAGGMTSSTTII